MEIKDIINDDLTMAEGWKESFKDSIGDSAYFDTVKDLPSLIKDMAPLAKMKGRQFVPGKDATPEEWEKFNSSLPGALKEGEDYNFEFKDFTDAQRAAAEKEGVMDTLKAIMRDAGVSQDKAAKIATGYINRLVEHDTRNAEAIKAAEEAHKEKWGENLDKNNGIATDAYDRFLSSDQREFLKATGLNDHPMMKEIMFDIGSRIQPGRILPGDPSKEDARDSDKPISWAKELKIV